MHECFHPFLLPSSHVGFAAAAAASPSTRASTAALPPLSAGLSSSSEQQPKGAQMTTFTQWQIHTKGSCKAHNLYYTGAKMHEILKGEIEHGSDVICAFPLLPQLFDVACTLSRSHSARYSYGRNCPVSITQDHATSC